MLRHRAVTTLDNATPLPLQTRSKKLYRAFIYTYSTRFIISQPLLASTTPLLIYLVFATSVGHLHPSISRSSSNSRGALRETSLNRSRDRSDTSITAMGVGSPLPPTNHISSSSSSRAPRGIVLLLFALLLSYVDSYDGDGLPFPPTAAAAVDKNASSQALPSTNCDRARRPTAPYTKNRMSRPLPQALTRPKRPVSYM